MAAVTTKDQERQAVEKIRKIVEGLGENSYVGTAMAGVLEVAEQNIEYDAAFSLKEEKEIAERREQEQTEITQKLIEMFTEEGQTVFDPFIGSGTTAVAAIRAGRKYLGCEIDSEFCDICEQRIKSEQEGKRA